MAVRYFCYNVKESVVFMYRVMIIDDEKALRNLLKASVDWQEMGLEVVGEAASGIEAINIIDKLHYFCRHSYALYGWHRIFQNCVKTVSADENHYPDCL